MRLISKSLPATAVITLALVMCVRAQDSRPKFEVASVKPYEEATSGPMNFNGFLGQPGGRFAVSGVNLKTVITYAYRLHDEQLIGGPGWISSDLWDIGAAAEEGTVSAASKSFDPAVPDTIALMIQSLLEDRFHLKLHREKKELPTYDLVIIRGRSKIRLSDDQTPPIAFLPGSEPAPARSAQRAGPPPPPRGSLNMFNTPFLSIMQGRAVPLSYIAGSLAVTLRREVVDKTNLTGLYDFKLQWTPDSIALGNTSSPTPASSSSGLSLFTALQEQLGLKLESSKGPVEVLVIDSVSRPTEN